MSNEAPMTTKRLAEFADNVENARLRHEQSMNILAEARSENTEALNALNRAQRDFDEAVDEFRKLSHIESDWRRTSSVSGPS